MGFRLVPKSVTLNDLERRNDRTVVCVILPNSVALGGITQKWLKIHRNILRVKCSPKNLVFSDIYGDIRKGSPPAGALKWGTPLSIGKIRPIRDTFKHVLSSTDVSFTDTLHYPLSVRHYLNCDDWYKRRSLELFCCCHNCANNAVLRYGPVYFVRSCLGSDVKFQVCLYVFLKQSRFMSGINFYIWPVGCRKFDCQYQCS